MKKKLLLLLLAGLLLTGCGGSSSTTDDELDKTTQHTSNSENADAENVGTESDVAGTESTEQPVYILEFENAVTIEGVSMSSDVFANSKLTMVNVWATFCGPCINEMPDLGEISAVYDSADFQLIGIVSDVMEGDEDLLAEAKEIIEETGANYQHLLLNEELYYNLVGASDSVPTTYFFNEKGELLGYLVGAQSKATWEEIIDELLEEME